MSALGFLLNLVTDSDDFDGDILGDSSDISDNASDISDNASDISDNASNTSDDSSNATDEPFQPSEDASVTDTDEPSNTPDEPSNTPDEPSNTPDEPSQTPDDSSEAADASHHETNININFNQRSRKPKRSWIYIAIGILGVIIILSVISSLGDDNFVPDNIADSNNNAHALASKGTDVNTNMNDSTSLLDAAEQGDVNRAKSLIDKGADVNAKDKYGNTPLHLAALMGHLEVMKLLISSNADVNARTNHGVSPLHFALSILNSTEPVKLLISSGADVNAKDKDGWTPLHGAALGMGLVPLIASDATEKDKRELTERYANAMEMLIAAGADINAKDNDGGTPLDVAVRNNRGALANVLRAHANPINMVVSFFSDLADIADRAGNDCDKLGADLNAHLNKNRDSLVTNMKKLASLDENSPEAQKLAQSMDKVMGNDSTISKKLDTCKDNPQIMAFSLELLAVMMAADPDNAPSAAAPTPSPAPAQNTGDSKTKSIAATIMRYAEHEISLEEGKTVGQFFSIKKGLKPCLKSPKKCSNTIAPLVDESYVKFNRGVIAAILLQNNDTFDKDLFKEVQKSLLIPMTNASERMRIANKSPVGREIMGANTLSNDDKINIFAIWYLRQFPYAGEDIWNNTPSTRRSWKDYLEMADLYLDAI